jgi:predicted membrane-bound spermidine synthase
MGIRDRFVFVLLLVANSTMGISQPENGIELPRATVTAGDQIEVKVTLQTPTECFRRVVVNFREPRTQVVFQVYGNVEAGGRAVTLGVCRG